LRPCHQNEKTTSLKKQKKTQKQVLAAQENDGNAVVRDTLLAPRGANSKPVLYAKHMAKHKLGVTSDGPLFSTQHGAQHVLLVRDPYGVVMSFAKVLRPTLQELGYAALLEIYSELRASGCARFVEFLVLTKVVEPSMIIMIMIINNHQTSTHPPISLAPNRSRPTTQNNTKQNKTKQNHTQQNNKTAARRSSSCRTTSCAPPSRCCARCARSSASASSRRCCTGRPAPSRTTASGRRGGMPTRTAPQASTPTCARSASPYQTA
jgi:hypothetical protein